MLCCGVWGSPRKRPPFPIFFSFFSTIFSIKHTVKRRLLPFFYRFLLRHMANFEESASFAVDFIFILWTFDSLAAKSKKIAVFLLAFDHTTQQKRGHFEFKKKL